jgi:serine/threonine-protein kinase
VLIKALSSSILPSSPFAATLEREARLLATLDHPNILHLYDFVRTSDRMWLVLEHVDGWTLDELLASGGKFSIAASVAIGLDLARALEHAHARGVVHRDVQPKNLLVSRQGTLKLINFTIAVDERLPTAPELVDGGTAISAPAYMSPEQILGEPPDPRSDLFSFGTVLYELLSGRRPFDGPDERATTQRIRHDAPPPVARGIPGFPSSLERLLNRCLEKLPSDRFQTTTELMNGMKAILKDVGARSTQDALIEDLVRRGLSDGTHSAVEELPMSMAMPARFPLRRALAGLVTCSLLIVGGGVAVQNIGRRPDEKNARAAGQKLELLPERSGFLRVVAEPWAHVIVDGQSVETTPFARPIPLRVGEHYVRLEHPNAPPERRTIQLVAGETVFLDIKMAVQAPPPAVSVEAPTTSASVAAPPSP